MLTLKYTYTCDVCGKISELGYTVCENNKIPNPTPPRDWFKVDQRDVCCLDCAQAVLDGMKALIVN